MKNTTKFSHLSDSEKFTEGMKLVWRHVVTDHRSSNHPLIGSDGKGNVTETDPWDVVLPGEDPIELAQAKKKFKEIAKFCTQPLP